MGKAKSTDDPPHPAKAEIRRILINWAKHGKPITYSDLVRRIRSIRLVARSSMLAHWLTAISEEEHEAGRGLLSAVVIRKTRQGPRIPGIGFFTKLAPLSGCKPKDWPKCWEREVEKVFRYWQRRHRAAG